MLSINYEQLQNRILLDLTFFKKMNSKREEVNSRKEPVFWQALTHGNVILPWFFHAFESLDSFSIAAC